MEKVGLAPAHFTITPRNPERAVPIGGRHMAFVNVSSPPNCSDLDRGRRPGDRESYRDLLKLTQYFNCIHMAGGYPVEPVDLHPSIRHLDCLHDKLTLTDKVPHAYALGTARIEDVMEMVRIAGGLTPEAFEAAPRMYTNINSSSPLKHDWPMLDGAMRLARRGQPVIVTPFTLAGAMAPVTLAGAGGAVRGRGARRHRAAPVHQAGRALRHRTRSPRTWTCAPAHPPSGPRSTSAPPRCRARWPASTGCRCAPPTPAPRTARTPRAAWESAFSLWSAVAAGVNVVYHAAGWLEGGLCASYEKFVMDCETLQQIIAYLKPVPVTDDDRRGRGHPGGGLHRPLLRLPAHPGPLRDRVLRPLPLRLEQLRELGGTRRDRHPAAGQRHLEEDPRRVRGAADGRRRSARSSKRSWNGASARAGRRPISDLPSEEEAMNLEFTDELRDFQREVRAFIEERLPGDLREKVEHSLKLDKEDYLRWQDILAGEGWLAYSWPVEYGGPGWSPVQCYIFQEELGQANAPRIIPFGPKMVGPVIYTFGNDAQKARVPAGHREQQDLVVPGLLGA